MSEYGITYYIEGKIRFVVEADNEDEAFKKCPSINKLNINGVASIDLDLVDSDVYELVKAAEEKIK